MIYCFDLDETLLKTKGGDYASSKPIEDRIEKVNRLFKENTIIIDTARDKRYEDFTKLQLMEFKVNYHILELGKPYADLYIDDKGRNADEFFT